MEYSTTRRSALAADSTWMSSRSVCLAWNGYLLRFRSGWWFILSSEHVNHETTRSWLDIILFRRGDVGVPRLFSNISHAEASAFIGFALLSHDTLLYTNIRTWCNLLLFDGNFLFFCPFVLRGISCNPATGVWRNKRLILTVIVAICNDVLSCSCTQDYCR